MAKITWKSRYWRSPEGIGRPVLPLLAFLLSAILMTACSKPVLTMSERLPLIVKQYKHVTIWGGQAGLKETGVYLRQGDYFSIIAAGSIDYCPRGGCDNRDVQPISGWPLILRTGDQSYWIYSGGDGAMLSPGSGMLYAGYRQGDLFLNGNPKKPEWYRDDSGAFKLDIIVWARDDYEQIAGFLEELKKKDPENKALDQAVLTARLSAAAEKTAQEIQETAKQLDELKQSPLPLGELAVTEQKMDEPPLTANQEEVKEPAETPAPPLAKTETVPLHATAPPPADAKRDNKIVELEAKLAKLSETLSQLDQMKRQLAEEREKTTSLSQELEEKEKREKELVVKLQEGGNNPPVIVVASPKEGGKVEVNVIRISGVAEDDKGIRRLEFYINGKPIEKKSDRGVRIAEPEPARRIEFDEAVSLESGVNHIKLLAFDTDGLSSEKTMVLQREESRKNVWAVVIGINAYPRVPQLKYALSDAQAFYEYLTKENRIPKENVTLLLEKEANLARLRSVLGTYLKNRAAKDDMVILYFAGHGATERDVMSPDGDGLEKYLLPYDADPQDLYASSLPMREVSHIFNRIRAERLVFLVDACYSGASGGRTIASRGVRANISDTFLDRVVAGRGTIVITASGANEVSVEDDKLRHGVFTHFLLEGLKGRADTDGDGVISVDEIYTFVSRHVIQATGQEQHPVKKGAVEGSLVLGIVQSKDRQRLEVTK